MTFLAPTAGIVAGAIAGPILLALYLLKLRRRPAVVSSTLLWERAVRDLQVNTPFRWLRPTLLLLIQALAVACLAIALARPAITDDGADAERLFIVIDRSASMLALDGSPGDDDAPDAERVTRLDEARRRARELVRRVGRDGRREVALVTFGARARLDVAPTRDADRVLRALDTLTGTDQPGDPAGSARLINSLQADAEEDAPVEATLILFSDAGFDPALVVEGVTGARVVFERVGDPARVRADGNVGLVALSAKRDWEDPALVRLFVRLQNTDDDERVARVTLTLDGRIVGEDSVRVPGATDERPGELARTYPIESTGGGLLVARLADTDLLASDDAVAMVLDPAARSSVLLVGPGSDDAGAEAGRAPTGTPAAGGGATEGVDPFLRSVLQVLDLAKVRTIGAFMYERMASEASLGRGTSVGDYDLVIFDRVEPRDAPPVPSLSFGRSVPGIGVRIEPTPPSSSSGQEPPARGTRVLSWRRTSPLMRYIALDALYVDPAPRVTISSDRGEALALGESGPLIVAGEFGGVRRVVVGFELARSNWGPDYTFLVFISNVLEQLALGGDAEPGRWSRTDEAVRVIASPGARSVEIEGPLSGRVPVRSASSGENAAGEPVSLGMLERAGVYTLTGTSDPGVLAVNLADARESSLAVRDSVRFGSVQSVAGVGEAAPREIWRWFLLGAGVLAMLEWGLYAWRMRA